VTVRDEAKGAIGGALLYLATTSEVPKTVTAQTNDAGQATLSAPTSGIYVLTAALAGFTPEVRAYALTVGCAGNVEIALKIGPMVIER
jgi:hypothetical protein